jgi:nitroreductase
MLIDLLRSRRSIRAFSDQPVEQEKLDLLIEATLRAPAQQGKPPWEFVVVRDRETITQLSLAKANGSAFIKEAALVVVVCAHPQISDVWVEYASIATLLLHLEAHDLGLGSCWVQVRLREHDEQRSAEQYITEIIGLDRATAVEAMVAIGYPAETKAGRLTSSLPYDKVRFEALGRG